jgi:N6-adenosine-specific RNA methylase IME4
MFSLIYADPAWKFRNEKTGGSHTSGASQKYPCMELDQIQSLPVQSVCSHMCALALWVPTSLKFSHGQTTAIAWGFDSYRTTVYWNKQRMGMGFWFRNQVEELLIFTRGDMPPFRCQLPNIISCPPVKNEDDGSILHSGKPAAFRQLMEKATGDARKSTHLELFARRQAPGWSALGHGVGSDIRSGLLTMARNGGA